MTFQFLWVPRRRSHTPRVVRFERPDARPDWAAELLPQPPQPQRPSERPERIDPFASEIVAMPSIPEPFSAVQEELDQMAQSLAPPQVPWPGFEMSDRNGVPVESQPPEPQPTVVARWNELALQAIRADKPVPTVITRALHLAHAAPLFPANLFAILPVQSGLEDCIQGVDAREPTRHW